MLISHSHLQKFLLLSWIITCQILSAPIAHAEPYIPDDDSVVLQTLPASGNSNMQQLRQLRKELSNAPTDLALAVKLAQEYLQIGRTTVDPRYDGYAQAALQPWWNMAQPPAEVLLLRAILRQRRHDFDRALNDLDHVLQKPALDRIVVDDKNVGRRHWNLLAGPRVMRRVGTTVPPELGTKA